MAPWEREISGQGHYAFRHQDEDIVIHKCNLGLYITMYDRGLSHIISIVLPIGNIFEWIRKIRFSIGPFEFFKFYHHETLTLIWFVAEDVSKKVREYDQEIPKSHTADKPMAPRGRAKQQSRDARKTNWEKQPALSYRISSLKPTLYFFYKTRLSILFKTRKFQ